ncbi:hypothetical protein [Streptomyces sedi]|uniref:hypothetical protein n=1 Tax=Streptomyces sedi TaxID=555059 RepID=UPI0031F054C9
MAAWRGAGNCAVYVWRAMVDDGAALAGRVVVLAPAAHQRRAAVDDGAEPPPG